MNGLVGKVCLQKCGFPGPSPTKMPFAIYQNDLRMGNEAHFRLFLMPYPVCTLVV
jgi:hypothetical protein